jgi:large repetitive protein
LNYTGRHVPDASDSEAFHFDLDPLAKPASADSFQVSDAHLLFSGDFQKVGNDLIISDPLHRVVVPHYFNHQHRPTLLSPEGAALDSGIVDALTGYTTYAQAGGIAPAAKVVGHVVKMTGSASILRNGVAVIVNTGDNVYQNDLVQTGSNSTLGLVLDDGTAFNLSANSRFMLNELNYDPSSTSNSSLVTLIQGAASFVAGQVAPTGDMKVATPVATIGIRGTAVILDVSSTDGTVSISVVDQHDNTLHSVQVFNAQGVQIGTVSSNGPGLTLTPTAALDVIAQESNKTTAQISQEFATFQQVLDTYGAAKQLFPNLPQHTENINASPNSTHTAAGGSTPQIFGADTPTTTVFSVDVGENSSSGSASGTIGAGSVTPNETGTTPSQSASSTTNPVILVAAAPITPVEITSGGGPTSQQTQVITGIVGPAFAGSTVTIFDTYNGVTTPLGATTVSDSGGWSATVTLVGNGSHSVVAVDPAVNSTSTPIVYTLEVVAPTVTITTSGAITNQATHAISGSVSLSDGEAASPGATVTLYDYGTQIGTATVGSDGTWTTRVTLSGDGSHIIVAKDTDAAGNTGTSAQVGFTLDTSPPIVTVSTNGTTTNQPTQTIAGKVTSTEAAPGTVTLYDNGTQVGTATVGSGGSWTTSITLSGDGNHSIVAADTDAAGNTGSSTPVGFTLDTVPPTVTIATGGATTNQASQTISGSVTAGEAAVGNTVLLYDNGSQIGTATVGSDGSWSTSVTLAGGANSIVAKDTDAAGNTGSSNPVVFTLESGGLAVSISTSGGLTNQESQTISGSVTAGEAAVGNTVLLYDNGSQIGTATVGSGGTWSTSVTLAGGANSIVAKDTDAAGNIGASTPVVFTLDTVAPTVTISTAGATTNQATQTISGTVTAAEAAVGNTVLLYDNGTQIGTATVGSGGTWSTSVTLAGGANSIVAKDTDAAGNIGTSTPVTFNVTITAGGWGNPAGGSWNDAINWSSGSVPGPTSNVAFDPIGATPYTVSILPTTTVTVSSISLDDPNVTLLDEGTLAIAGSLVETSGTFEIANGGALSLGGGSSLAVDFVGTGGSLALGPTGFTGTIDATSSAFGAVTISGAGAVTTAIGDAIDVDGSGGTPGNPSGGLGIALTGAITGAVNGISVEQNGFGPISITTSGAVVGNVGAGIRAEDLNAADTNNVLVSTNGNVSGISSGIYALTDSSGNVRVSVLSDASITAEGPAIEAISTSGGDVFVTTSTGDIITSDSDGINANNQAAAIPLNDGSTISVTAYGAIYSGPILNSSGSQPAGILAGYKGGTNSTINPSVFGSVTIDSYANITATGGDGIRGYNYGSGNIAITDETDTTITAPAEFGIRAINYGSGNISVTTLSGDSISSGASGISAINQAIAIAGSVDSSVNVIAYGTINSGTNLNPSGFEPQGISAGYFGVNGTSNTAINGSVSVVNYANITAAAGWGIDAFNYGSGSVSVTEESGTNVSGAQYGIGAYSNSTGSGSVTVSVLSNATIVAGSLYGASADEPNNPAITVDLLNGLAGIAANESNVGNITVTTSAGDLIESGGQGIQASNSATGNTSPSQISITSLGTIYSGYDNAGNFYPAGIGAGYNPGSTGTVSTGNVFLDNSAQINAPWVGINLYNFGTGNINATLEASSTITATLIGVNAYAQGGGSITLTNSGSIVAANGSGISIGSGTGLTSAGHGTTSLTNSGTISALGAGNEAAVSISNDSVQAATFTNSGSVVAALYTAGSSLSQAIEEDYGGLATNVGTFTIDNSGTISGNVSLNVAPTASSTFNNQSGGTWNLRGQNFLNGVAAIINSGTINIAGPSGLYGGTSLAITNSDVINVAAAAEVQIAGAVTGSGTFHIGNEASLEFTSTVSSGQTVSFDGNEGLLVLDNPQGFGGTIGGLAAGDIIELQGGSMSGASVNGSDLMIAQGGGSPLNYTLSSMPAQDTFSVLSGNLLLLVPTSTTTLMGSLGAESSAQSVELSNAAISSSTAIGLNIAVGDSNSADTVLAEIDPLSSIAVTGAFAGLSVTTTGANITIVNAGGVASSGSGGIYSNDQGAGSVEIFDTGNVTGTYAIEATSTGTGLLSVNIEGDPTIKATGSAGIIELTSGSANVTTGPQVTLDATATGILIWNEASSDPFANNSLLSVDAAGAINSGLINNGYYAGIAVGYLGATSAPASIPNPPLSGIFGNVEIDSSATITAASGVGINAFTYGTGYLTISSFGSITATAAGNTTGTGDAQYGITATNDGSGNVTVVNAAGATITSGSAGIIASNFAVGSQTAPLGTQTSPVTISVVSQGTITSGTSLRSRL